MSYFVGGPGGAANQFRPAATSPGVGGGAPAAGGKGSTPRALLGLALAGGLLGLGALFGRDHSSTATTAGALTSSTQLTPPPSQLPDQPFIVGTVSGAQVATIPRITGIANQKNLFGSVPVVYGTVRINPPLAAQFISINQGGRNYALGLFCLGRGELAISDIRVGQTPIDKLPNVKYQVLPGTLSDPAIKSSIFTQDVKTFLHGAAVKSGKPITKTLPKQAATISVDISFLKGLYTADSLGNKTTATVDFDVFYGVSSRTKFAAVTASNSPSAGSNVVINIASTANLAIGNWVTITGGGFSELTLITNLVSNTSITVSQLRRSYTTPTVKNDNWTKALNGISTNPSLSYTDVSTQPVTTNLEFDVPTYDTYDVLVQRNTADSTSTLLVNASTWKSSVVFGATPQVTPYYDSNGNQIPMAYIAVKFLSGETVNGQIPNLNCLAQSKLQAHSGGIWQPAAVSANNAWVIADILTGQFVGRPDDRATKINAASFEAFATFCDNNGRRFDFVFDQPMDPLEAAQMVASVARAIVDWRDGQWYIVIDQANSQVASHITQRNIANYSWSLTWPDLPEAIRVNFNNAAAGYVQDQRLIFDDGYSVDGAGGTTMAKKYETLDLPGVTTSDHAWREARYRLAVAKLRRMIHTFDTDWEHLKFQPFDLIKFSNDVVSQGLGAGRITGVTLDGSGHATSITTDETFTMIGGSNYSVCLQLSDGSSNVQTVVNVAQATNVLTFTSPITVGTQPAVDDLVLFGIAGNESAKCIVKEIAMDTNFNARVTLIEYQPGIFDAETGTIPAYQSAVTYQQVVQQTVQTPTILDVQSDETVMNKDTDGAYVQRVQLTLDQPANNVHHYETQWRQTGSPKWGPSMVTPADTNVVYISNVQGGVKYDIRIRSVTYDNFLSDFNEQLAGYLVIGDTTIPPDVPVLDVLGENLDELCWQYDSAVGVTVPFDLAGFQIRRHNGANDDWNTAVVVANLITNYRFDVSSQPPGLHTYMIKAVDVAGNMSANARVRYLGFGDATVKNLQFSQDEAPTFPGTLTGGTVISGVATASAAAGTFWRTGQFWTNPRAQFWTAGVQPMDYSWSYVPEYKYFQAGAKQPVLKLSLDISAESYSVNLTTGSSQPFYSLGPNGPSQKFWGSDPTKKFWSSDETRPWPGSLPAKHQKYQFTVSAKASKFVTSRFNSVQTILDVSDVAETLVDIPISASGTRLPIVNTYREIDEITFGTATGGSPYYADKNPTLGPLVYILGPFGVPISGVVTARIVGW